MPVYNCAKYLEKAIKSLLEQNYPNLEFIVLDAASTDGGVDIIRKYEKNISYWRSQKDRGANAAYNEGIDMCKGDIVLFLNADDWLEPDILQKVSNEFQADSNLEMISCYARYISIDENGKEILQYTNEHNVDLILGAEAAPNCRFYRKSLFERYGRINSHDNTGKQLLSADWQFIQRLSLLPVRHKLLREFGYNYLMHEGSITYGANSFKALKRINEEQMIFAAGYIAKRSCYSRKVIQKFIKWHSRATARLYLLAKYQGQIQVAEDYKKQGLQANPLGWHYTAFSVKRKKQVQKMLGNAGK